MARRAEYELIYAPEVVRHLKFVERVYHRVIQRAIIEQLTHTPATETRNRKPLAQPAPFGATWEIRCGTNNRFRVFYEVDEDERIVNVLAIGVKEGNRLFIGGEEQEI